MIRFEKIFIYTKYLTIVKRELGVTVKLQEIKVFCSYLKHSKEHVHVTNGKKMSNGTLRAVELVAISWQWDTRWITVKENLTDAKKRKDLSLLAQIFPFLHMAPTPTPTLIHQKGEILFSEHMSLTSKSPKPFQHTAQCSSVHHDKPQLVDGPVEVDTTLLTSPLMMYLLMLECLVHFIMTVHKCPVHHF